MAEKSTPGSVKWKRLRSPYTLIIIGGLIVALIVWQFYKYKIVNKGVGKMIAEKSQGLYSIHYESLLIDEVSGTLHVKNIEIMPDTAVYNRMVGEKTNPPVLIRLTIPSLEISGVKTPKALLAKQVEGGKINIMKPAIEIEVGNSPKDSTVYDPGKDISRELLGKLLKIKIDSVQIIDANVVVRNMKTKDLAFKGNNVSFLLSDLLIDSVSKNDNFRILFSRDLTMTCDELLLPAKSKKYRLHVEKLHFVSRNNSFNIGRLTLVPQLSEAEFARSSHIQEDRYDIILEGIGLINIDRERLWHKEIEADSLVISKSSVKIYRDLSYPRDTTSKVGKYPQQLLMHLPVPVNIRKMICSNSFIEYKEKNAKSDRAGKVQFYKVRVIVSNITNIKTLTSRNNKCILLFNAKFLNEATVNARLVMLLKDPRGKFVIEGNMGAIKALSLNPLVQPMGLARIEKGNIDKLHFYFRGTDSTSAGKVTMVYNDIKISLLKKDNRKNEYDRKGLESLAAGLFIKKSNPGKNGKIRTAEVHFTRILNKSFFNLLWKSIFTGVKETVGMKL